MTANPCPRTGEEKRACKCSSCIGRRNRASGGRKATAWWNAMGAKPEKWAGRAVNEETRTAEWRAEVKSGKQVAHLGKGWAAAELEAPRWAVAGFPLLLAFGYERKLHVVKVSHITKPPAHPWHILAVGGVQAKIWATAYGHAREQSDEAAQPDDVRPFIFGVMPPGTSDGFAVFDQADGSAVTDALFAEWAKG